MATLYALDLVKKLGQNTSLSSLQEKLYLLHVITKRVLLSSFFFLYLANYCLLSTPYLKRDTFTLSVPFIDNKPLITITNLKCY